jgi:hypothetical protein
MYESFICFENNKASSWVFDVMFTKVINTNIPMKTPIDLYYILTWKKIVTVRLAEFFIIIFIYICM